MRQPLDKKLRKELEVTVIKAHDIAEQAVREELLRLTIGDKAPADYLTVEQRSLRKRLRAHSRQLGDRRKPTGEQSIEHLVTEAAYEHWHRMLFARFLAENNLLMYEDGVTALAIQDCFDLAEEETCDSSNGWQYAANYAAKMLPQIFRVDSPVFALILASNHQKRLEQLLANLADVTFQAQDSLGWVYQFWQTKKKAAVNASEVKIGADELSAVTQLFTEPYMVSFLLDNSLGAWWKMNHPDKPISVPLTYLRILEDGTPAAGKFEAWPKLLGELKVLDPSCGSGHFLVEAFLMLVPMRMAVEGLSAKEAVDAVLSDNIHGLELDQRCVELAAFALALTAWRYPQSGGYRALPEMHIACSGLSVSVAKDEWKQLAKGKHNLSIALDWLHESFRHAPVLGSLINPTKSNASTIVQWEDLSIVLGQALSQEQYGDQQIEQQEVGIAAQGLAKSASLLAGKYHLVITNVPYLTRGKQSEELREFCEQFYPTAKNDLATVFLDRCIEFCVQGGTASIVLPQNWLFLTSYKKFREKLLTQETWQMIARLGAGAFETISGEVVKAILLMISRGNTNSGKGLFENKVTESCIHGIDVSEHKTTTEKAKALLNSELKSVVQCKQLDNPDARITLQDRKLGDLLSVYADSLVGIQTGDYPQFAFKCWEIGQVSGGWEYYERPGDISVDRTEVLLWENEQGRLFDLVKAKLGINGIAAWIRGRDAWGMMGVSIKLMNNLTGSLYTGAKYDQTLAVIVPKKIEYLASILCFCTSAEYNEEVRRIDQKLNVTNSTLVKVPFELERWSKVAKEKFPKGLPKPYSDDPTQWIFHGHPAKSAHTLQVVVARLLGYLWPAEIDTEMELSDEARNWIDKTKILAEYVDDDGIVCISAVRGEKAAHERLEELLHAAFGDEWSSRLRNKLLEEASCKNTSLDFWLREKFFEQHCKLFQNRPFIWHLWDGLKDGFSALVNYHMLDKKNLERLIYTYLDDWIRTQNLQQADGMDGATERLAAAENLKQRLEQILEGEAPYDIFVRWKPLKPILIS